jgi:hypothetical protein
MTYEEKLQHFAELVHQAKLEVYARRGNSPEFAARIVRQFKSLRGKYDKYQWGLTALNVADEMIAVVRTKPKEPQ